KFDPISQADYYRLQAFFAAAQTAEIDVASAEEKALVQKRTRELNERIAPLKKQVEHLDSPCRTKLIAAKKVRLELRYQEALAVDASKRAPPQKKLAEEAETLIKVTWDEVLAALTPEERAERAKW